MTSVCVELCVEDVMSARHAVQGGAQRIELCAHLASGGLTPSAGLIERVCWEVDVPVFVMIRPRSGDFHYDDAELSVMETDIRSARDLGAAGVVLGVLSDSGTIHNAACQQLLGAAADLSCTFHRAFDHGAAPNTMLEELIELGFERVLTSGQAPSAWEGRALIRDLIEQAQGRIVVLPGAGINADNVGELLAHTAATEIHAGSSVCEPVVDSAATTGVALGREPDTSQRLRVSVERVTELVSRAQR